MENNAGPPGGDLAREERLLEAAAAGPILYCYSWPGRALVLGHGQREQGLDLDFARARSIPVVRRITGGTGVYHHDDLAVSLALSAGHPWAAGIRPLYDRMKEALAGALGEFGIHTTRPSVEASPRSRSSLCFADHSVETLLVEDRKSVGCSQARRRTAILVHAFLLFNNDLDLTARLFRMDPAAVTALIAPLPLARQSRPALQATLTRRIAEALELEAVRTPLP